MKVTEKMQAFEFKISICNTRGFKQQLLKEALKQMQEHYEGSKLQNVELQFTDQVVELSATIHIPGQPLTELDT